MANVPQWVVGIDEVGRGALAGPVVVAATLLPTRFRVRNRTLGKLKDSKKLSARQREAWLAYLKDSLSDRLAVRFAMARVYPRRIERWNISRAANVAAEVAFEQLMNISKVRGMRSRMPIFLDGGLFLGNGRQPKNARTVVKGDERITAIKIASIVAKVYRDRLMRRLAKKYPVYGFDIHKGYGTKAHLRAIRRYGPSSAHRLTFLA